MSSRRFERRPTRTSASAASPAAGAASWMLARYRPDSAQMGTGSGIARLFDLTGHGYHTDVQATASAQPTLNATGYGARPTFTLDGVNDTLNISALGTLSAPFGYFVVMKQLAVASAKFILGSINGGQFRGAFYQDGTAAFPYLSLANGSFAMQNWCELNRWSCVQAGFGASALIQVEDQYGQTGNSGTNSLAVGIAIGSDGAAGHFINCEIAEIVVYSTAPTAAEIAAYRQYVLDYYTPGTAAKLYNVCAIGDSLTAPIGGLLANWVDRSNYILTSEYGSIANYAVGGATLLTMSSLQLPQALANKSATLRNIAVLMGGFNDYNSGGADDNAVISRQTSIVSALKAQGFKTIIQTIMAARDAGLTDPQWAAKDAVRVAANVRIRAGETGADLVADYVGTGLDSPNDYLNANYRDQIHLTNAGYIIQANLLSPIIQAAAALP